MADPAKWGTRLEIPAIDPHPVSTGANTYDKTLTVTRGNRLAEELFARDDGFADLGNPYNRSAPLVCNHVYYAINVLSQEMPIQACCFMRNVPGYEPVGLFASDNFFELWNCSALVNLPAQSAGRSAAADVQSVYVSAELLIIITLSFTSGRTAVLCKPAIEVTMATGPESGTAGEPLTLVVWYQP